MLDMVRHATNSFLSSDDTTATFMLLLNLEGLNAISYMPILRELPEQCTIKSTIPQASVTYCRQELWIGNNASILAPQ